MRISLVFLSILVVACPVRAADSGFRQIRKTADGITVSRAPGQTRGFFVSRYDVEIGVDAATVAAGLWKVFENAYPPVVKRTFIERTENGLLFHDKVKTPVVSDREYTLRVSRSVSDGVFFISFFSDPCSGPPPEEGYVRMAMVRGGWEIRPVPAGCTVRYEIYTEPGGLVPALLVKEPLTDDALNYVRRCLKDAVRKD